MEETIEIFGGKPLSGEVTVSGAKNAALPIFIATLLTPEKCVLRNVPRLHDVGLLSDLLTQLGGSVNRLTPHEFEIEIPHLKKFEASYSLVKSLRASFWVLAPLLARGGSARVAMPGGDVIGARPVDIHLDALTQMGADIKVKSGVVIASAPDGLKPAEINFRFPSVGATHQILMAASLTSGKTVIRNAACEPEVQALADVLSQIGAEIEGAGTPEIVIHGTEEPKGFDAAIIGDRIEAATYLLAVAVCGGSVVVKGVPERYLGEFLPVLHEMGVSITSVDEMSISLEMKGRIKPVSVKTGPFPQFATDMQAPLMAALTLASGKSVIEETVYEGRFGHVAELSRMGAKISLSGQVAEVNGVQKLLGAVVEARDIRAGAAMVVAGLAAQGRTVIEECQHLRRGYDGLEEKLRGLGAHIVNSREDGEELSLVGC